MTAQTLNESSPKKPKLDQEGADTAVELKAGMGFSKGNHCFYNQPIIHFIIQVSCSTCIIHTVRILLQLCWCMLAV